MLEFHVSLNRRRKKLAWCGEGESWQINAVCTFSTSEKVNWQVLVGINNGKHCVSEYVLGKVEQVGRNWVESPTQCRWARVRPEYRQVPSLSSDKWPNITPSISQTSSTRIFSSGLLFLLKHMWLFGNINISCWWVVKHHFLNRVYKVPNATTELRAHFSSRTHKHKTHTELFQDLVLRRKRNCGLFSLLVVWVTRHKNPLAIHSTFLRHNFAIKKKFLTYLIPGVNIFAWKFKTNCKSII